MENRESERQRLLRKARFKLLGTLTREEIDAIVLLVMNSDELKERLKRMVR